VNHKESQTTDHHGTGRGLRVLERITGVALILVIIAVGWMIVVAYRPGIMRLGNPEWEVVLVSSTLVIALVLISSVALAHTWKMPK
jgi:hypothetical protein